MNAKAIALFAVLAVALTGGFAIAGADAAEGDDFTAEYWTEGPYEGVDATFATGLPTTIQWYGNVTGADGAVDVTTIVTVTGKVASLAWDTIPLTAGTYQVSIYNPSKTSVFNGSFDVAEKFAVTFTASGTLVKELLVDDGAIIADQVPEIPAVEGMDPVGWVLPGAVTPFDFETTPITEKMDFTALYKPKEYTITIDSEIENGTVTADKEKAIAGQTVTLTVTPAEGYQIESVTVDGVEIEGSSFPMPNKNVTVSATFELKDCIVTFFVDEKVYGEPVTVTYGETLTSVPEAPAKVGSTFDGWYEAAAIVPFEFDTPITDDLSLFAMYDLIDYTVKIVDQTGEEIATETANFGDKIDFDVTAPLGYQVKTIVSEPVIEDFDFNMETYEGSFTMPASDVTVTVTFELIPEPEYTITIDSEIQNGTVTADKEKAKAGETVTLTATPAEGYTLAGVTVNEEPIEGTTFEMPSEDVTVSALFVVIPVIVYDVTISELIENGTITADHVKAEAGATVTLTNTPAEGYVFNGYAVLTDALAPVVVADDGTFVMPADNVTVLAYFLPETVITYTVNYVDQEGKTIATSEKYEAGKSVYFEVPARAGADVEDATVEPEVADFEFMLGIVSFTMPENDVTVIVTYKALVPPVPERVTVTFLVDDEEYRVIELDAGGMIPAEDIPVAPEKEGMNFMGWMDEDRIVDFTQEIIYEDMTVIALYIPEPVMAVSVTFMDGETEIDTKWVEIGDYLEEVPEAAVKEGFNFVGWCVNDIPTAIDFETTPIIAPMVVYATYIETPDIGEGFAILYHDMYQGKPVDIWWKGYASKDDRVMLANGMDATAIFMGWLAEDQETLFSWNAAYDLNDIERNDCLIYPASYGYPGTDRIYELNAIYALEIEWVSFDGETVLKTDEVIRGDYLDAPFDDEEMQDMLDDYKPSDEGYSYTWAGWNVPGVGTYTSEDVEYIKANGSWRIVATYEGKVNEYDITFNWHDGTSTIRVPYGDTPEIENPPAYEDDNFTYTFAGWDPEVKKVDGDATYTATYDKTSKTKDVTITVNDPVRGYFTYGDKKNTEYILKVPMDFDVADIDEDVLTFDLLFYLLDIEIPETLVITAVPNDDDFEANKHFEFVKWNVSEDGLIYTAEFTEDIITSKDLDRIQTFFDYTKTEGGDVVFTLKSKDGLAIPKGTMTVWYYEIAYLEDIEDWVQIERSCDAIEMDWDEETYGKNLISMTIEYADLTQDGEAFDITSKTISTMWLVFDGVNGAHCESNKATPGQ